MCARQHRRVPCRVPLVTPVLACHSARPLPGAYRVEDAFQVDRCHADFVFFLAVWQRLVKSEKNKLHVGIVFPMSS